MQNEDFHLKWYIFHLYLFHLFQLLEAQVDEVYLKVFQTLVERLKDFKLSETNFKKVITEVQNFIQISKFLESFEPPEKTAAHFSALKEMVKEHHFDPCSLDTFKEICKGLLSGKSAKASISFVEKKLEAYLKQKGRADYLGVSVEELKEGKNEEDSLVAEDVLADKHLTPRKGRRNLDNFSDSWVGCTVKDVVPDFSSCYFRATPRNVPFWALVK